jgi:hypothetical protein
MSQDKTLAYAAGLLDGEGHYGIAKVAKFQSFVFRPRVIVRMTHKTTIDWLKSQFGGHTSRGEAGERTEEYYSWMLGARPGLLEFLPAVAHFAITKKVQALFVLEFMRTFPDCYVSKKNVGPRLEELTRWYEVLRGLNSVGPGSNERKDELSKVLKMSGT